MSWIYYLLEANLYKVLFYGVYYVLLRRDTYYQLNRTYLIASSLLAFVIPLTQLGFLKSAVAASQQVIMQINPAPYLPLAGQANTTVVEAPVVINYYLLVYVAVAIIMAMVLGIRIYHLTKLARKGKQSAGPGFKLVVLEDESHAFSFFNYLFISTKLSESTTIIQHELVHIRQKHSLDILYTELIKIICWFNPVVYLLQNSIKQVHEFIADRHIAQNEQDVNYYTDFLISNAYGLADTTLTNNFFNKNQLKNRIMMLHQKRSGSLARLKYLVALPLLGGMLCLSTLGFTKDYSLIDLAPAKPVTTAMVTKPIVTNLKQIFYTINPANYSYNSLAIISTRLYKQGYVMNFREFNKGSDSAELEVSLETSAAIKWHNKASATFRVGEMAKSGYVIMVGADLEKEHLFVHSKTKVMAEEMNKKTIGLQSPPPAIQTGKPKLPPPPAIQASPKADQVRFPPPALTPPPAVQASSSKANQTLPPPPAVVPYDTVSRADFTPFYRQLQKMIRYPREAHDNLETGKVFVTFNIGDDNKPYNFKIARGLSASMNAEVIRVLTDCTLPETARKDANYTAVIAFALKSQETDQWVGKPTTNIDPNPNEKLKPYTPKGYKTNLALNEVVVAGFTAKK